MAGPRRIIIMGAAGRDFHDFNVLFRRDPETKVVAFTAAQIPFISDRRYPPDLAGPLYPKGIPIRPEEELPDLIKKTKADAVLFAYSDLSHEEVMHRASLVVSLGADFILSGATGTMLRSKRPVISVAAVRTGAGKSGVTRFIAAALMRRGLNAVAIRHPMPYGDLSAERVQRFASVDDMMEAGCTVEEMEEYEPLVASGVTVWAGVDYAEILGRAERTADVVVWDGGNNDLPFIRPDLEITVADPLRAGHEIAYHPGEANLLRADIVVINKVNAATRAQVAAVAANVKRLNPGARIIETASVVSVDGRISGKKVLVIEDGPTLTHGGMAFGAGIAAALRHGASPVDPRPYAVGTIKKTFEKFPHIGPLLPAMGYSAAQKSELARTIERTPCDAVLIATPVDLRRVVEITKPAVRVSYEVADPSGALGRAVAAFIARGGIKRRGR